MPQEHSLDLSPRKQEIRVQAHARRQAQQNKDELSRTICATLAALPEFIAAGTVMLYVDVRDEVRTRPFLPAALTQGKRIVVPYCVDEQLKLFHLDNVSELSVGTFQVWEPKPELRSVAARHVEPRELDLAVTPGVAFDRAGGRIGHGLGYLDKLLAEVRPDTSIVALAFECQIFPDVPVDSHDIRMNKIITERGVIAGRGRPS